MNKSFKILSIVTMILMVLLIVSNTVMAAGPNVEEILGQMESNQVEDTSGISRVGGQIVSIMTTVAIILSVIVLVILGIKYMIGSASEKAEYKKTMIPYLVGAVLIFASSALVRTIFSVLQQINTK